MFTFSGIGDKCSNAGVTQFTELLSDWSGSQGYCMYVYLYYTTNIFKFGNSFWY